MNVSRGSMKISHSFSALRTRKGNREPVGRYIAGGIGLLVVCFIIGAQVVLIRQANNDPNHGRRATANLNTQVMVEPDQKHHLIFSTSCHFKQDWQSYLFFYQAMSQKQPGDVTRIVSGCNEEDQAALEAFHKEKISVMSDKFHLHFTPDFGRQDGANYQQTKYWNKPFGVRHWLEHQFGYAPDKMRTLADDDVIILVDPDMLLQTPIINDFKQAPVNTWTDYFQEHPQEIHGKVEHGQPISQIYAYGASWLRGVHANLTEIVGPVSPVHSMSMVDAARFYPSGPPYMLTGRDMYNVAYHWTLFTPKIFELTPVFMSEMYGYSMAAAHLGLRHQMARGFMASNVELTKLEGWDFLDTIDQADICDMNKNLPHRPLVIHFCQRYALGEFFVSKYKTHHEILTCDHPLMEQPPKNAVKISDHSHYGNGDIKNWSAAQTQTKKRHGFMVCHIIEALNGAATWFKDNHCPRGANYDKVWNFFKDEGDDVQKRQRKA